MLKAMLEERGYVKHLNYDKSTPPHPLTPETLVSVVLTFSGDVPHCKIHPAKDWDWNTNQACAIAYYKVVEQHQ